MIDHRTSHAPDRVPRPLSERLKAETRDEHRRAETHPLMAAMVSGRIDRATYARYLGQMRHVHATLDAALRAGAQKHGALAVVVREQYLHDVEREGYDDGRAAPHATLTPQDIAAWTEQIPARQEPASPDAAAGS